MVTRTRNLTRRRSRWVRIPQPEIGKLACQAQGAGIFSFAEIPELTHSTAPASLIRHTLKNSDFQSRVRKTASSSPWRACETRLIPVRGISCGDEVAGFAYPNRRSEQGAGIFSSAEIPAYKILETDTNDRCSFYDNSRDGLCLFAAKCYRVEGAGRQGV